jgi:hypothetical protein
MERTGGNRAPGTRADRGLQRDPIARELARTPCAPMVNQNVNAATELPALMASLEANE